MMLESGIYQRKKPVWRSELDLLEKARASKLEDRIHKQSQQTPLPIDPHPRVEPFHNNQTQAINNCTDDVSILMLLVVILVVICCYQYQRIACAYREYDKLIGLLGRTATVATTPTLPIAQPIVQPSPTNPLGSM